MFLNISAALLLGLAGDCETFKGSVEADITSRARLDTLLEICTSQVNVEVIE